MRRCRFRLPTALVLFPGLAALSGLPTASANDKIWTGIASSGWNDPLNWSGGLPTNDLFSDIAVFNSTGVIVNTNFSQSLRGIRFDSGAGAFTLSQNSGSNTLTLGDAGIATFSASNQRIEGGALSLVLGTNSTFAVNGQGSLTIGVSALSLGANTLSLAGTGTGTGIIASTIGGSGGLTVTSSAKWILSNANTYTGGTTITAGTLQLQNTSSSSSFSMGSGGILEFVVTSGARDQSSGVTTFSGAGTLRKSGAGEIKWSTGSAVFAMGAGGLIDVQGGTFTGGNFGNEDWTANASKLNVTGGATFVGLEANVRVDALTGAGAITSGFSGAGYQNFTFGVANGSGDFSGSLGNGASAGNYVKAGSGTQTLSGTNTFTGTMTVAGGTLQLGNGGATGSVAGNIANDATLVFNRNNSVTYGGTISGIGAVTQAGTGLVTLTGANTFTGLTTISAGTLQLGNGGASGSVAGNIANNAALVFNRSDNVTYGGVISGTGTLAQNGTGTLTLTNTNTFTGLTTVSAGTLQIGNGGATGSVAGNIVNNAALVFNRSNVITYGGVISGTGTVNFSSGGHTTLTGANTYTGLTTVSAGGLALGDGVTDGTITGDILNNTAIIFSLKNNFTYGGTISGTGQVVQAGAGTVTLTHANTYAGITTLYSGGLAYGADNVLGTGDVAINGGTLDLGNDHTDSVGTITLAGGSINGTGTSALSTTGSFEMQNGTVGVILAGTGALNKTTAGTVALTGANTYTGGTTISAGTLQLGNGGATGSVVGNIANNAAVVFNRSDSVTYGGAISGTGTVTQAGTGVLTLTNANTFTGLTSVSAGTLAYGANNVLATGGVTVNGGTLDLGSNHTDTVGTVTLAGGGINGTGTSALSTTGSFEMQSGSVGAILAGAGALNKTTAGTATLTGANTYTGGTTISAGTLQLGNGGTTGGVAGGVTVASGATLAFNRSDAFALGTVASGAVSGAGNVAQLGTGTLMVNTAQAYTGTTTVSAGTLAYGASNLLGTGAVTINGGTLDLGSNHTDTVGTVTLAGGSISGTGTSALSTAGTFEMQSGSVGAILAGAGALNKTTTGTVALSAANTFSGLTTVSAGTLAYGTSNALGSGGVTVNGGTLDLGSNHSDTVGTVTLAGGSIAGTGTSALTTTGTFVMQSGAAGAILTGAGVLIKTTGGTVTLTGANTYTGGTELSAGTLQLGNGGTTGSIAGDINNNAALVFNRSDVVTYGGAISGGGTLTQAGAGTLILTGANAYYGLTTISAGTLQLGNGSINGTFANQNIVNNAALVFNRTDNVNYGGTISGTGAVTQAGTGILTLVSQNTFTGLTTVSAGTLAYGVYNALGTGGVTINGGTLDLGSNLTGSAGTVTLASGSIVGLGISALTTTGTFEMQSGAVGAILAGIGALNKTTGGTVTLTGANTYTGGTLISAGTLQLGNGGTTGSVVGNIVDNAALVFNRSDNVTYGVAITGSGALTQNGAGTLILTGANTYTGLTTVSAGGLQLGNGGTTGSVAGNIVNDSALVFNRSGSVTYGGAISGSGTVTQAGTGILTLTNANTYAGLTTVSAGTLAYGVDNALATGAVTVNVGSSRVDLQACKLEYSIVSPK